MQWIDSQKKIFGLVHWVDLLVILASVLVITKAVWSFWPMILPRQEIPVRIVLTAVNIRPEVAEQIKTGQWLKEARSGAGLGIIIEKKTSPHILSRWEDGRIVRATDEGMLDIRLTLKQTAVFKESDGIFIGSVPLRAGRKGLVYTINAEFNGEVIEVAKNHLDQTE